MAALTPGSVQSSAHSTAPPSVPPWAQLRAVAITDNAATGRPYIIVDIAKAYNNAFILCEVNDIGDQVASIIQYDLEYDNLLLCSMRGRAGQIVGQGFSGKKTQLGVKMSKTVKKVGCSNLKTLIVNTLAKF